MIRILYIHHSAGWGGSASSLIKLINNLDQSKYIVKVLLLKHSDIEGKLSECGINYSVAKSSFFKKYYRFFAHSEAGYLKWYQVYNFMKLSILWLLSRYYFAKAELSNYEADIVHLNSSVLTDWIAPAKNIGKVIIHIREPYRRGRLDILHTFFKSKIYKYADIIIAISKDNAKRINIPSKTEVIYNFSEIPILQPSRSSYSSKKVLYIGGSSTSKGFYSLVEALDYLDKDVKVYFGGKYVTKTKSQHLVHSLRYFMSNGKKRNAAINKIKNHPNAIYLGLIHNVDSYLSEVCCIVSPFLVPHFSRPVIEAHLHRKPAIGSNVEGMDEIITHERNGLIVSKNNPVELAFAINKITANYKQAKKFGEDGYSIAIQKFTPENTKQFEVLYDSLNH